MQRDINLINAEVVKQGLKAIIDFGNLPSDWLQQSFPATSNALRLAETSSSNNPATSKKISKVMIILKELSSAPLRISPVTKTILASAAVPSTNQPTEPQVRRQILFALREEIHNSLIRLLKRAEIKSKEIKTSTGDDYSQDKIGVKIHEIAKIAYKTFRQAEDKLPPTKTMLSKLDKGIGIFKIIEKQLELANRSASATVKERKICEASIDLFHQELLRIEPTKENLLKLSENIFALYQSEISKAVNKKREAACVNSVSAGSPDKLVKPSREVTHGINKEKLNKPKGKEIPRKRAKKRRKVPIQATLDSAESSPVNLIIGEISTPKENERFPKDSPEIWPQNGGLKIRVCYLKGWNAKDNAEEICQGIRERNFGVTGLEAEVFEIVDRATYRKLKVGSVDSEGFLQYKYDLQS